MTDLHNHIRAMYHGIAEQDGKAPNRLGCAPTRVARMHAIVQELGLPLLVQPDEECDENLCYLTHAGQPERPPG